jgi:hypothetical protein
MLFLLTATIFFLSLVLAPLQAQSFNYQFVLKDNSIDLNFSKLEVALPSLSSSPTPPLAPTIGDHAIDQQARALSFVYSLEAANTLIPDLPLVLLVGGEEVLFYATSAEAGLASHQVWLDLSEITAFNQQKPPVFYKNHSLGDFTFQVSEFQWLANLPSTLQPALELHNLTAVREQDQSLTILFAVNSQEFWPNTYYLVCQSERSEQINRSKLIKTDDFLWPNLVFLNFTPNHKQELIFQLPSFACGGLVFVVDQFNHRSEAVSIIGIEKL